MRIAICDDDKCDLELLRSYCAKYDDSLDVSVFASGSAMLDSFKSSFYDLVFLDIEMPDPDGLTVGMKLIELKQKPIIIFTTQSLAYAVRGYGIATRYLPKPIDYDTFLSVMRLATGKISSSKIAVLSEGKTIILSISDITFFEVLHHAIIFHLQDRRMISTRGSLSDYMRRLIKHGFAQPHKSYGVNMDYIDRISRQMITLTNGETIPIGRSLRDSFHVQFDSYLRGNSLE